MLRYFFVLFSIIFSSLLSDGAYFNKVEVTNFPATQAVTQSGSWTVLQGAAPWSFSLPSGASTSALQTTGNGYLLSIDSKIPSSLSVLSGRLLVDGSQVTQPVSGPLTNSELRATPVPISGTVTANLGTIAGVATESTLSSLNSKVTAVNTGAVVVSSSALPTGAATAANQTTANASLASIDSKVTLWQYHYQSGIGTVTLKTGSGYLKSACYVTPSNGSTITFYDNIVAVAPIISVLSPINGSSLLCIDFGGVQFTTGLTFLTTGTGQWTISYR